MPFHIIILRLLLAVVASSLIGYDREHKSRPAGLRTHILVCLGACTVALIQENIMREAIEFSRRYPEFHGVIRSDPARLICQVISGIGFLGAGTIIVTKRSVTGLTTAASLWTSAAIGLALGMGYYAIAFLAVAIALLVLGLVRWLFKLPIAHTLDIRYTDHDRTFPEIQRILAEQKIHTRNIQYSIERKDQETLVIASFHVEIPVHLKNHALIEPLSKIDDIRSFKIS